MFRRPGLALLAVAALAIPALVACGDDDDDDAAPTAAVTQGVPPASSLTINVQDNSFPAQVRVAKGGKVSWTFRNASNPHSVLGTSANATALIKSATFTGGTQNYEVTFSDTGTYEYQCGIHGASMTGKILVQ
jgi:plastocyanin